MDLSMHRPIKSSEMILPRAMDVEGYRVNPQDIKNLPCTGCEYKISCAEKKQSCEAYQHYAAKAYPGERVMARLKRIPSSRIYEKTWGDQ